MATGTSVRGLGLVLGALTTGAALIPSAGAQQPPAQTPPAQTQQQTQTQQAASLDTIVEANKADPAALAKAVAAAVVANPALAADVVALAKSNPAIAEALAQGLSIAQSTSRPSAMRRVQSRYRTRLRARHPRSRLHTRCVGSG